MLLYFKIMSNSNAGTFRKGGFERFSGTYRNIGRSALLQTGSFFDRYWTAPPHIHKGMQFPFTIIVAGYSRWDRDWFIKRQAYDLLGVELVTAGNIEFIHDGQRFTAESGDVFIKLPDNRHYYKTGSLGYVHKRFITIRGFHLHELVKVLGLNSPVVKMEPDSKLNGLFKNAVRLFQDPPPDCSVRSAVLCYEILVTIAQAGVLPTHPPWMTSLKEHMLKNLHRQITVDELISRTHMSSSQLYREFEKYAGEPPLVYFRSLKMDYARDMLAHTSLPIKSIAHSLGYDDALFFSRQFKKVCRVSPRSFRLGE